LKSLDDQDNPQTISSNEHKLGHDLNIEEHNKDNFKNDINENKTSVKKPKLIEMFIRPDLKYKLLD